MNFTDQLKAASKDEVVIKAKKEEVKGIKASTATDFSAMLKKSALETKPVEQIDSTRPDYSTKKDGLIAKWSFSALKSFETCQWKLKLQKIDKIDTGSSEALDRGNKIHDALEKWVRGEESELPSDKRTKFDSFLNELAILRSNYFKGYVSLEEDWGIRKDWSPCTWQDPELWGRAKLDVFVLEVTKLTEDETADVQLRDGKLVLVDGDIITPWETLTYERMSDFSLSCRIIDYKSGRRFGNELTHADQSLCYALNVMHRYPDIESIQTEFWYVDQGEKSVRNYNRRVLGVLGHRYHDRAMKLTTCVEFMPIANPHSCRFCPFGSNTNKAGEPYGNSVCKYDFYMQGGGNGDDF